MMLRELLCLHRSDRHTLLVLLALAALVLCAIYYLGDDGALESELALRDAPTADTTTLGRATASGSAARTTAAASRRKELFPFDPNTADSVHLVRLGLQPWQAANIIKYRQHGGIYQTKEDFAQLYGLTAGQYRELEPYIRIAPNYQPASRIFTHRRGKDADERYQQMVEDKRQHYQEKINVGETVDLNALDTMQYKKVPGIGPYFARRILDFGRRLGGYATVDQLDEIEYFPTESKEFFEVATPPTPHLYINRLTVNDLKRHPYINYYQARAIVDYRRQHGPITDLYDLRLLDDFDDEAIRRLLPYVSYE